MMFQLDVSATHSGGVSCPYFCLFPVLPRSNFWNFFALTSWAKWIMVREEVPPGSWPKIVGRRVCQE